jgi:hypothetical protein
MTIHVTRQRARRLTAIGLAAISGIGLSFAVRGRRGEDPRQDPLLLRHRHRVKNGETERLVGSKTVVQASYYDDCKVDRFNPAR